MIDPHVHLRDWTQRAKETVRHGLEVAARAGLDAVFEMPNTNPPLTTRTAVLNRIALADEANAALKLPVTHGLFMGLTEDLSQIEEAVQIWREFLPRVVGLKMFAGHSTGNMGIVNVHKQLRLVKKLVEQGFDGVLAVHCEKQSLIKPGLWNPKKPVTHTHVRPAVAEVESIHDIIAMAENEAFRGNLHICHISTTAGVGLVSAARQKGAIRITCGVTPHHLLLSDLMMNQEHGLLLKMNPPLRDAQTAAELLRALVGGKIDWVETDHAPHTLLEKQSPASGYPSGIPVLPVYPHLIGWLKRQGMSPDRLEQVTHGNICRTYGQDIPDSKRASALDLAAEYEFDPFNLPLEPAE